MHHTGQCSDRACHAQVCMFAAEAGRVSLQSGVLCSDSMTAALAPCGRAPPKQAARQKRGPGAHPAKDSTPTTSRTAARQLRRSPAAQRFFPVALPLTRGKTHHPVHCENQLKCRRLAAGLGPVCAGGPGCTARRSVTVSSISSGRPGAEEGLRAAAGWASAAVHVWRAHAKGAVCVLDTRARSAECRVRSRAAGEARRGPCCTSHRCIRNSWGPAHCCQWRLRGGIASPPPLGAPATTPPLPASFPPLLAAYCPTSLRRWLIPLPASPAACKPASARTARGARGAPRQLALSCGVAGLAARSAQLAPRPAPAPTWRGPTATPSPARGWLRRSGLGSKLSCECRAGAQITAAPRPAAQIAWPCRSGSEQGRARCVGTCAQEAGRPCLELHTTVPIQGELYAAAAASGALALRGAERAANPAWPGGVSIATGREA